MAISTYMNEMGETRFRVYVNVRSKSSPSIRIQKRLADLKTLKEAEREELKLSRECEREIIDKESDGSNWKALVAAWEEHLKRNDADLAVTTQHDYNAALRNHTSSWMERPAAKITIFDIRELLDQMKANGYSQEFRKKYKNMLNRVFSFGIQSGLIQGLSQSPTIGVKLERIQEKQPEILNYSEIRTLLAEAKKYDHPWYPIWAMALLTGMRNGELYALQWGDIDWENKLILVSRSYNKRLRTFTVARTGHVKHTKGTKSGYWRTVPISSELLALLKELKCGDHEKISAFAGA